MEVGHRLSGFDSILNGNVGIRCRVCHCQHLLDFLNCHKDICDFIWFEVTQVLYLSERDDEHMTGQYGLDIDQGVAQRSLVEYLLGLSDKSWFWQYQVALFTSFVTSYGPKWIEA